MVASERSNKTRRRTLRTVSAKESAHADHASQEAARVLIPPPLRSWPFAPSVTTPLYNTTISKALRQTLRAREVSGQFPFAGVAGTLASNLFPLASGLGVHRGRRLRYC